MVPRPSVGPKALANDPRTGPVCPTVTGVVLEASRVWMPTRASPHTLCEHFSDGLAGATSHHHPAVLEAPIRRIWTLRAPQVAVETGCPGSCGTAVYSPSAKPLPRAGDGAVGDVLG